MSNMSNGSVVRIHLSYRTDWDVPLTFQKNLKLKDLKK